MNRLLQITLLLIYFIFTLSFAAQNSNPTILDPKAFDPKRPLSQELIKNIPDGFTLAMVGDCILSRPLSQHATTDPEFGSVLKILRESDALYGNLETTILDIRKFTGYPFSWEGDWVLSAESSVAKDLSDMGFDLFSRANNHALDWGIEGMRETDERLDAVGITHAGTGANQGQARSAGYFDSANGRIALISMASSFRPTTDALPPKGASPGRPGINALKVKTFTLVPPNVMSSLVQIQKALNPEQKLDSNPKSLELFGSQFEVGSTFGYRYEMNEMDLQEILKSIRLGKQHSDFLLVSIHSHESSTKGWPETPADFLKDLAHAAIDAGADAFATTGHHHLGPIEVYKNRPIFYGLGNFFWSDIQEPLSADLYQMNREKLAKAFQFPEKATDADLTALLNKESFANELTFQTIVAVARFDQKGVAEIRLYPVDLGYGKVLRESGTPRMASPETATKMLTRLQKISAPYDTRILIENNVGIIRPD